MASIRAGDTVPAFDLEREGGGRVTPEGLRGAPYVLFVYPKADTSGCTLEANDFTRLMPEFEALGVAVIGVSPDPVKALQKFRTKHGLGTDLASDEGRALLEALGVWVEKQMYGRTYMGAERTTLLVDREGRVARVWEKVSVPGHADEVLVAARALAA